MHMCIPSRVWHVHCMSAQILSIEEQLLAGQHAYCTSYLCKEVGFFDDWRLMGDYRSAKIYISLAVCIQRLEAIKLTSR